MLRAQVVEQDRALGVGSVDAAPQQLVDRGLRLVVVGPALDHWSSADPEATIIDLDPPPHPAALSSHRDTKESSTTGLLAQGKSGSLVAVGELLERHLPGLRAFVRLRLGPTLRAVESESDLVQSVCVELLDDLGRFEYRGEAQFRHWLYTAVLNKICKRQRHYAARKRQPGGQRQEFDESLFVRSYEALSSPSHQAIQKEQVDLLERAFDLLPEHYREVLTLSRIVGLTQEETAAAMQCTVPAMRNLLSRALVKLAAAMAQVRGGGGEGR